MNRKSDKSLARPHWLTNGGEMGKLIRLMDWSGTPVGPIERWPQSLKTAVSILLNSRFPMFVWWGPELTNIYNDAYMPMLGPRHPHALGKSAPQVWADVWPVVGPQAEAVMREGRSTWNESTQLLMERYGFTEETYFTFSYSPAPDDAGSVGGVFCAVTEDTARVLGERRLKTLRDLGERSLEEAKTVEQACHAAAVTLADNLHDIPFALIYLLDEDGKHAHLSESVNLPAGTKASPATVLVGSSDDVWSFGRVIETRQRQITNDLEDRFGRLPAGPWADDSTRSATALPLAKAGSQEAPGGFLVAGISPRLAFNEDYSSFLDLAAGQIANAISNARAYEEERKRAEALAELDRAKTAFFSNVSHEFRTPLTLTLGPLEDALAADGLSPEARGALKTAHRNSLRLLKLVNMLLDFSRIEAGRMRAVYEPTDLATLTADLASVFRSTIERAGIRLIVYCPPLDQPVYVDRELWEKIVLNLISNAFKFTFEGEIEVSLKKAGDSVELTVRDTGVGIPAEELPHIFDRFYRVKGVSGRSYEGSGIGLALVQELTKLHGGMTGVESEVSRGSVFTVSFPLGMGHLPADRIGTSPAVASPTLRGEPYVEEALRWLPETQHADQGMPGEVQLGAYADAAPSLRRSASGAPHSRILLADDNADMRDYVQRLLREQYEVAAVVDGEKALKAARERAFDLILTDVMMPRLDGFGLLRELRSDERTREIPVILLSARAGEESKIEGLEAGANDYLIKPFSARELLARVETTLNVQRVRRESQEALRASEQKFSAAFNQSPLPTIITSLDDGRLAEVNESFVQLSGYTREEALGRTPEELRLLAEWELRNEGLRRLRAGERLYGFEARFLCKNGEERIGVVRASLIEINSRPHVLSSFTDITERKQAEGAIRQLAAIVESSDDAIVSKDLNGIIKSWNKGAEKLFGYRAEEVIGKSIMIVIPSDRADEETRVLESIRRGEGIDHYETIRQRKDGSLVEVSLTVSPIRDDDGYVIGASKIAREITERKQVEQALAEGVQQQQALYQLADQLHRARSLDDVYNAAFDAMLNALQCDRASILLIDDAGVMRFAGWRGLSDDYRKAVEGRSPWKPDETYPEPISVNDVDVAEIDDSLKTVVKSEGIGALAFIPLVSRGRLVGKLTTYFNAPHVFSHDELALSVTIARQLAFGIDRKRAEELLQKNASQLSLITNIAPVYIAHCDAQARFKFVNKPYAGRFGLTPEDCIGRHIAEIVGEEAYRTFKQHIEEVLRGEPVEFEVEIPYTAIGTHFMHCSYAPEFGAGEKVIGFVAAITDISERKQAEKEIARLLTEEQAARDLAEQATRAKDEFLAVVSHELRSPLNAILGWNRLLRSQRGDDPQIAKVAETVERNGKAQLQLIEDLLDTARIISGKMKLEFQPVEPVAVISSALDTVRPAAESKGVVMTADLDLDAGQVTGDPNRLQQVVWNLVSNAIKFTPSGGHVQVELRRGGTGVQIVVHDTGQGINPDLLPYVFDRFKQGDSETSRRHGGLGLGLALVKHLVELHGGSVAVDSPGSGQGATFVVNLPVRAVKGISETAILTNGDSAVDRRAGRRTRTARLEGLRALVVDDEAGARELLAATLEQYGVLVTGAVSSAEALATLESQYGDEASHPFDVLISDIGMPEGDGYELMQRIRSHSDEHVSRIRAIALTAYARTEDRLRALRAGYQMHVPKPVDEEELTTVIAALTDRI